MSPSRSRSQDRGRGGGQAAVDIAIAEGELRTLTDDLDEAHRATLPEMRSGLAEVSDRVSARLAGAVSRRGMLVGGLALTGLLAGCSGDTTGASAAGSPSASPSGSAGVSGSPGASATGPYRGELRLVALSAALENLAVNAYGGIQNKIGSGAYGTVPPAVSRFVATVRSQHADHAAAWNAILTAAKLPPVTGASLKIAPSVSKALDATRSVKDVASFALSLENGATQTYVKVTGVVNNPQAISTAATIAPVEAMHAAILNVMLGRQPPVPDSFIPTTLALDPNQLTG